MRLDLIAITLFVSAISIGPVLADYTVGPVPDIAVEQGGASGAMVRVTDDAVRFSMEGLPPGATAAFEPESCASPCESKLTVKAGAGTPPGQYSVLVKISAGTVSVGRLVNFTVTAAPTETPVTGLFSRPSTWTEKLPANPNIMPTSPQFMADFRSAIDKGLGMSGDQGSAFPVWRARADTKYVKVKVAVPGGPGGSSYSNGVEAAALGWDSVPIPQEAIPEGGNDGKGDRHMIVIDAKNEFLWEFFKAHKDSGGNWSASILRRWPVDSPGVASPYDGLGTGRVCVPISQGLILLKEIKKGRIEHAIALNYNSANANSGDVYPCEDTGGTGNQGGKREWAMYNGFRLQLDPNLNIDALKLSFGGKVIARALQEYGMIFIDNSGGGVGMLRRESMLGKTEKFPDVLVWGIPLDKFRLAETLPLPTASNQSRGAALWKAPINVTLTLSSALLKLGVTGVSYHYTLDGSDPTTASLKYGSSIAIPESATLKFRGFKANSISSGVGKVNYLAVNDQVASVSELSIRSSAGGSVVGKQNAGVRGKITGGPSSGWWKVDFESGPDGWARSALLEKADGGQ